MLDTAVKIVTPLRGGSPLVYFVHHAIAQCARSSRNTPVRHLFRRGGQGKELKATSVSVAMKNPVSVPPKKRTTSQTNLPETAFCQRRLFNFLRPKNKQTTKTIKP